MFKRTEAFWRSPRGRRLYPPLILACLVFSVWSIADLVRTSRTRDVERSFVLAVTELQKSPPGFARANTFLTRLRSINTDQVTGEVKEALREYANELEAGLAGAKNGKGGEFNQSRIEAAQKRLLAAFQKHRTSWLSWFPD